MEVVRRARATMLIVAVSICIMPIDLIEPCSLDIPISGILQHSSLCHSLHLEQGRAEYSSIQLLRGDTLHITAHRLSALETAALCHTATITVGPLYMLYPSPIHSLSISCHLKHAHLLSSLPFLNG
ncbi:hypothetical protein BDF22DRAFT_477208 [Syncephalis plumigaleata]|nr:hypothetical protein BDF22DRAFT_477208 [Syncephalis plumigaleata]